MNLANKWTSSLTQRCHVFQILIQPNTGSHRDHWLDLFGRAAITETTIVMKEVASTVLEAVSLFDTNAAFPCFFRETCIYVLFQTKSKRTNKQTNNQTNNKANQRGTIVWKTVRYDTALSMVFGCLPSQQKREKMRVFCAVHYATLDSVARKKQNVTGNNIRWFSRLERHFIWVFGILWHTLVFGSIWFGSCHSWLILNS